jgi:hypothetical protein
MVRRLRLEPYPPSYFVVGLLRLLIQLLPDLVAVAAIVEHQVAKPKGSNDKCQKANDPHLNLPLCPQ